MMRQRVLGWLLAALAFGGASLIVTQASSAAEISSTTTPIKHLVVIFQENVSFDHYFATYPDAANPPGEPHFTPQPGTPTVNGLTGALLTANPNQSNPQRLDRAQAFTCDQDHDYTAEQSAVDRGLMDMFVQQTGGGLSLQQCLGHGPPTPGNYAVMDYYDGNTVTGLWNYAQRFSLSDNSFGTTFGPSTPGALNVTAGNTYGATCGPSAGVLGAGLCQAAPGSAAASPGHPQALGSGTIYGDPDPNFDVCSASEDGSTAAQTARMGGQNIGDLLDRAGITWGWFQGGFASPGYSPGSPRTDHLGKVCTGAHPNIAGQSVTDYSPHHEPFQYFASTANPRHLPPTSIAMIGHQDQANHQYDLRDFWAAADAGNLPAVSYLKAARYQDGHAGYSDPLDEQHFLARTINRLEQLPTWRSTAVVIAYDDSDGWYDHQLGPILTQSQTPLDALTGTGTCGSNPARVPTTDSGVPEAARCGVGPRLPLLVVSPYARRNFVDHAFTDQSSVIRFVEDNWLGSRRLGNGNADAMAGSLDGMFQFAHPYDAPLYLNPSSGEPEAHPQASRG